MVNFQCRLIFFRQGGEVGWFLSYEQFTKNQIKSQLQKEPKYISNWNDLVLLTSVWNISTHWSSPNNEIPLGFPQLKPQWNKLQQYAWICELLMEPEQVSFVLLRLAKLIKWNSRVNSKFIFYFMLIQIWFDMLLLDWLVYFTVHINRLSVCVYVLCSVSAMLQLSLCWFFLTGKMTDNWCDIT